MSNEGPVSYGIPERPMGLSEDEERYWGELINQIPARILTARHPVLFRELCAALAMRDRAHAVQLEDKTGAAFEVWLHACNIIFRLSKSFGMSPKDRQDWTPDGRNERDDDDDEDDDDIGLDDFELDDFIEDNEDL